ncbi:hypothetical protein CEQ23_40405 [Burkholderia cepacia]|nr:hypothetical protein CEQ23_40405 [Burkholderia cepacia]QCY07594.1 hypothetical protein EJ998_32165 [Burkholderia cepacia ATCC 25416]
MQENPSLHGGGTEARPLTLVRYEIPVIAVAPNDLLLEKLQSNRNQRKQCALKTRSSQITHLAAPSKAFDICAAPRRQGYFL